MRKHIPISGMHCRSCEILVERHLTQIPDIRSVRVDHRTGVATLNTDDDKQLNERLIEKAVRDAGYTVGHSGNRKWLATNQQSWFEAILAASIVFVLYLASRILGFSSFTASTGNSTTLSVVFIVGLTAGVSTCAALVGGLVLAASARYAELHPNATSLQKFRPHLFFNVGRVISFAALGGLVGIIGASIQLSPLVLGLLIAAAGLAMIALGLKLTELFPRLETLLVLPSGIARLLGLSKSHQEYSHTRAAMTGALTFFLPCGFTQAMQLAAVASGSFTRGAAIMGVFVLGTTPGLLGIGGLSAIVRGPAARLFFKITGIIVLLLGLWNVNNGWNLTGIILTRSTSQQTQGTSAELRDGKQYITMEQWAGGYNPLYITVKRGIPVVWNINSTNSYTCASSIVVPVLGIRRSLSPGTNVIEFIPTQTGQIKFSCSMGMYTGSIEVIN